MSRRAASRSATASGREACAICPVVRERREIVCVRFMRRVLYRETSCCRSGGLSLLQGGREVVFGQMAAASLTGMIPVYLLAVFMQRWLIGGLTQGSIK